MSTELLPESETAADERLPEAALPDARAAASERTLPWPETAVEPVRVRWRYAIGIPLIHLLACLAFVPWLDTSKVRSTRFRPMMKQFFWLFVIDCLILGYCGSQGADASLEMMQGMQLPLVWVARVATLYYFGFFWVVMPLLGIIERPKPLPASISQPVLAPAE